MPRDFPRGASRGAGAAVQASGPRPRLTGLLAVSFLLSVAGTALAFGGPCLELQFGNGLSGLKLPLTQAEVDLVVWRYTRDVTVEQWARINGPGYPSGGAVPLVEFVDSTSATRTQCSLSGNPTPIFTFSCTLDVDISGGSGSISQGTITIAAANPGAFPPSAVETWTHYAFVFTRDPSPGYPVIKAFVNGTYFGEGTYGGGLVPSTAFMYPGPTFRLPLYNGATSGLLASLKEVRVWSRALNDSEIWAGRDLGYRDASYWSAPPGLVVNIPFERGLTGTPLYGAFANDVSGTPLYDPTNAPFYYNYASSCPPLRSALSPGSAVIVLRGATMLLEGGASLCVGSCF